MDINNASDANACAAAGCAQLQQALNWIEANEPEDAEELALHGLLARLAARFEAKRGVAAGTFANPDSGTNKP